MPFTIPSDLSPFYVVINGVPLATTGWRVLNTETLLSGPDVRGEDRLVPGATNVRARRRRSTVSRRDLQMQIYGAKDSNNGTNADVFAGLITNIKYLRANVVDPPTAATYDAVLHYPDASTQTKPVHVVGFPLAFVSNQQVSAVLSLEFPSGVFT